MVKIVGIGDYFLEPRYIESGFAEIAKLGAVVETVDWGVKDRAQAQNLNLLIEQQGSEAYECPPHVWDAVADADVIVTQFFPVGKKMIGHCPNLKAIGVLRGGTENVNLEYATEKGILVFNTPGRNANAVADFTVGLIISEMRNIARSFHVLKEGGWAGPFPNKEDLRDLCTTRIGIVGLGSIGRGVAERLRPFGAELVAYDPFLRQFPDYIQSLPLEELMRTSDCVSVNARLTDDTYHLVSRDLIFSMKPDAYLFNTARSGLVDEAALVDALREGRIMGAGIDVFDSEPIAAGHPFRTLPNITVTAHLAGSTNDAFNGSPALLAKDMIKLWQHREPAYIINKDVFHGQYFG